ncbi:hypothetical protein Tco_0654631 [Tanacetum coccineum]|uniref:Uncharacterized protein n=1 Tax=Tanacetum coccineum TaxID=301880 RepID=A0ABQ4X3Z8_9ASTR
MSDEPLGDDSKPRSYDVTFSNPLFDFNDDFTLCNDNPLFDEEFEDISSLDPPESTPVIDESSLLVTPLPDPKQIFLMEVERFDHFFSLTQSGGTTRVMKTSSLGFHHMPLPCLAAYSPKENSYDFEDLTCFFQSSNPQSLIIFMFNNPRNLNPRYKGLKTKQKRYGSGGYEIQLAYEGRNPHAIIGNNEAVEGTLRSPQEKSKLPLDLELSLDGDLK